MTDPADTIRSSLLAAAAWGGTTVMVRDATPFHDALGALDALLAEQQQLQERLDIFKAEVADNVQAMNAATEKMRELRAERQQAQEQLEAEQWLTEQERRLRQQAQEERDQIARDYEWAWEQRQQAIDALREIEPMQQQVLAGFQKHGIVFDRAPNVNPDPSDWQQVAFSVYTSLCEVDSIVSAALVKLGENA